MYFFFHFSLFLYPVPFPCFACLLSPVPHWIHGQRRFLAWPTNKNRFCFSLSLLSSLSRFSRRERRAISKRKEEIRRRHAKGKETERGNSEEHIQFVNEPAWKWDDKYTNVFICPFLNNLCLISPFSLPFQPHLSMSMSNTELESERRGKRNIPGSGRTTPRAEQRA